MSGAPRRAARAALLLGLFALTPVRAAVEQVHHELALHIDPAARTLHAVDRVTLRGDGVAHVRLAEQFRVRRASLDGRPLADPDAANAQQVWRVALDAGRSAHMDIEYSGVLAPLVQVDHRGTLERLPPMADARGTYLPAGSGWYPAVDEAAFTYRLTLRLPAGQRGLVPGRLVEEEDGPEGYRAAYAFPHPAQGIDLMAGPYTIGERLLAREGAGPVRLRTWFHPEIADLGPDYLEALDRYLDLYAKWIDQYPFTEFSVVSSPLPTGFGMPTLTYLGIDVLRLPFIRSTSLGHEVLHNWWGNGVYVNYSHGNWAEGLTTFMADYTYRERESETAAREMRQSWLRDFAAIPPDEDMPLRGFTARTHGTSQIVGYHKAAFAFLMLRDHLGSQRFDAGLRRFWDEHRFRRASWADLQRAFEDASGERLEGFFEQWLARRGAPRLRVEMAHAEQSGERHRVTVTLAQSGEPYALLVPLVLDSEAGSETHVVDFEKPVQQFVLDTAARPRAVRLDPQLRLFRHLDARELPPILRQVMLDPATRVQLLLDADARPAGLALAGALLDHVPDLLEPAENASRLVIGTHDAVDRALADAGLPPRPDALRGRGSAQVWTAHTPSGRALAVISARDLPALQALARPLPHYGRQSWLVFEGARAVERGVWPGKAPAVPVTMR
jgi:aminopeptidase N